MTLFPSSFNSYVDQQVGTEVARQVAEHNIKEANKGILYGAGTALVGAGVTAAGFLTHIVPAEHFGLAAFTAGVYEAGKSLHERAENKEKLKALDTGNVTISYLPSEETNSTATVSFEQERQQV